MKKLQSIFLALALVTTMSLMGGARADQVQDGAPCPHAGQNWNDGKNFYLCVSKNGKTVWTIGTQQQQNQANQSAQNNSDKVQTTQWLQPNWDVYSTKSFAPACKSSTPLTKPVTDLNNLVSITPLGFVQSDAHNMPVPHLYMNANKVSGEADANGQAYRTKRFPVFAPADIEIAGVVTTITNPYTEYSVSGHVCGTLYLIFNHLDNLLPSIKKLANNTGMQKLTGLVIKAGTQIGTASGRAHGFDFRAEDASQPVENRMNPHAFTPGWSTTVCPLDLYPSAIKKTFYDKLDTKYSSNQCGTPAKDVAGTASGAWLNPKNPTNAFADQEMDTFTLASHNVDPTLAYFSIGSHATFGGLRDTTFTYNWIANGLHNPQPTKIKDGNIACIDGLTPQGQSSGESYPAMYIQYNSAPFGGLEKITVGIGSSSECGNAPYAMPANNKMWVRYNIPSSKFRK